MLAYVVGRPSACFTTENLLSRKNRHFKMALKIDSLYSMHCFTNQKGRYAKTHRNVKYILNGYLFISKYAVIAYM